jgi:hypothetical protein
MEKRVGAKGNEQVDGGLELQELFIQILLGVPVLEIRMSLFSGTRSVAIMRRSYDLYQREGQKEVPVYAVPSFFQLKIVN